MDFPVEQPREAAHGDYAVNAAMVMAKPCHLPPREVAKAIAEYIDFSATEVEKMEIAGPGFLNFRMKAGWLQRALAEILEQGETFGRSDTGRGQRVQVEFVSANPTGELHMGNARGAAIGDSLASILSLAGWQVQREYYVNDAGNQIEKFAATPERAVPATVGTDVPFPEDGLPWGGSAGAHRGLIQEGGDKYLHVEESLRKEYLAEYALEKKIPPSARLWNTSTCGMISGSPSGSCTIAED